MNHRITRRTLLLGAAAGLGFLMRSDAAPGRDEDELPDGSAAKDAITPEAQRAIDRGLQFLATNQNDDGSWGERHQYYGNVAVTSLAGLALMAGGHQPGRGPFGRSVERGIEFLLTKEARDGDRTPGFLFNPNVAQHGPMYSHGFGTLFLSETYGMIPKRELQKRVREALERAVKVIVDSQNQEGGWRYQPKPSTADSSVTICQIMALRAARNAGLHVPKNTVDKCIEYVKGCQNADGGFSYFRSGGPSAFARSAAGLCALYCAGVYKGKEIEKALKYLMQFRPNQAWGRRELPDMHYYYGQYYAAQAMWTAGGDYWKEWYPAIRDELLSRSRVRSDGVWSDPTVCNHYGTAMACIILQIPNNYLPILQK